MVDSCCINASFSLRNYSKPLHLMYKSKHSGQQLEFVDFYLPFGGKLKTNNRWVILRSLIPWDEIEEEYAKKFSKRGPRALSSQIALGSLIIKERLNLTDEETAAQISENPYLQYFIGFEEFSDDLPFDSLPQAF